MVGASTLAVILLLKKYLRVPPEYMIAVVGATVIVGAFDLAARADVSVLGPLPQGLPTFTIPSNSMPTSASSRDRRSRRSPSCRSLIYERSFPRSCSSARTGTNVNSNQEMVGLGAANLAAGFFSGLSD